MGSNSLLRFSPAGVTVLLLAVAGVGVVCPAPASATSGPRVNVAFPPVVDSTPALAQLPDTIYVTQGQIHSQPVGATDPQGTIPSLYADILPPTAEFHDNGDGTGLLLLQPTVNLLGDYVARVIASDGEHADTATLVVCFLPPNVHPPHWKVAPESLTVLAGTTGYIYVVAEDADGTIPGLTALDLPVGASFSDHEDGTGLIVFSPAPGESGRQVILIIASDGIHTDTAAITLIAGSPEGQGDAEWAYVPDTVTVWVGTERSVTVLANGRAGLPVALRAEDLPANASFTDWGAGAGSLTFAPAYAQLGSFTVLLIATEGGSSDSASVVLLAKAGQNLPPVWGAIPESTVVRTDEVLELNITVIDPDGPPPRITVLWLPPNAEFQNNQDGTGTLVFAPYASQVGSHIVGFLAFDGAATSEARVRIVVVKAENRAPVWMEVPDTVTIPVEDSLVVDLAAGDPDHDPVSITVLGAPSNSFFIDNHDGTAQWRFIPSARQEGAHIAWFIVRDGALADTARIVVIVTPIDNRRPKWVSTPSLVYVLPATTQSYLLSAVDPDSTVPVIRLVDGPGFAQVADRHDGTATLTLSPGVADVGEHTISMEATDGDLGVTALIHVIVPEVGDEIPDTLIDTLGVDYKTMVAAIYQFEGTADLLQIHDLDGDGRDEIAFRATVTAGQQRLVIWVPPADTIWRLPEYEGMLKGYAFRQGPGGVEPLLRTSDDRILAPSAINTEWEEVGRVPPTAHRFAWLPGAGMGGSLLYLTPRSSSSTTSFAGCNYYSSYAWCEGQLLRENGDTAFWKYLGRPSYGVAELGDLSPVIQGGVIRGLLIPTQHDYTQSKSGNCMPNRDYDWKYYLSTYLSGDTAFHEAASYYSVVSYGMDLGGSHPDPSLYGMGLAHWRDGGDPDLLPFAWVDNQYNVYGGTTGSYSLVTRFLKDPASAEQRAPFAFSEPLWHAGIICTGPEQPDAMLLAGSNGIGHVFTIPDARYAGFLRLPHTARYKTAQSLAPSRRDLVFVTTGHIEIHQVIPATAAETPRVLEVPGAFPTIQRGIDAARDGDTVRVGPAVYFENLNFRGKRLVVISTHGSAVTAIQPVAAAPAVKFVLGEAAGAELRGFRILGSNAAQMVFITNYAKPRIIDCEFRDFSGSRAVVECSGGELRLEGCRFRGNGGFACVGLWSGSAEIVRNIFDHNFSKAAIAVIGGRADILNNTLSQNNGGVTDEKGDSQIRNNIVVSHSVYGISRTSYLGEPSARVLDYNNVWSNAKDYQAGAKPGAHDISVDPRFRDHSLGDYRLDAMSLCLDSGDPNAPVEDPDLTIPDLGAIPFDTSIVPRPANLSITGEDRLRVVGPLPDFNWVYLDAAGALQHGVEFEIGTDGEWSVAEMWSSGFVPTAEPHLNYSGPPLQEGRAYWIRARLSSSSGTGPWFVSHFRMNSEPMPPTLFHPAAGSTIRDTPTQLMLQPSFDPDGDSLAYDFEVYRGAPLQDKFAEFHLVSGRGDTILSPVMQGGLAGHEYYWRARTFDGFEYSPWTSFESFHVISIPAVRIPEDQPNIQAGIFAAADGDSVIVGPGRYTENISLLGKRLLLVSRSGPDSTIICAADTLLPTVSFVSGEPVGTTIQGFTITGSRSTGVCAKESSPVIRDNIITGNIAEGWPIEGGGISLRGTSGAVVCRNRIYGNVGSAAGAGICDESGVNDTICHNVLHGNAGTGEIALLATTALIRNNTISVTNWAGIYQSHGVCRVVGNIVFFAPQYAIQLVNGSMTSAYNCTFANNRDYKGVSAGPGAVTTDALLVDTTTSDYHLRLGSPCIDAGDPDTLWADPDGSRNDIGAFPYNGIRLAEVLSLWPENHNRVVSHTPQIHWTGILPAGEQTGFELEVGQDNDWQIAELWDTETRISTDTSVRYEGPPLIDGSSYSFRLRLLGGTGWSAWYEGAFQMNERPPVPITHLPARGDTVPSAGFRCRALHGQDTEPDALFYDFQILYDSASTTIAAEFQSVPGGLPFTDSPVFRTVPPGGGWWWRARVHDGFEYSPWSVAVPFAARPPRSRGVPADFATIQAGIDAAADEDTVLVAAGLWTEALDWKGKGVKVVADPLAIPRPTLRFPPAQEHVLLFQGSEPASAQLSGFDINCGNRRNVFYMTDGASPTISDNVIRDFLGQDPLIYCWGANPRIERNLFINNWVYCIGIYSGHAEILNNTFDDNYRNIFELQGSAHVRNNIITNSGEYAIYGDAIQSDYNNFWNNPLDAAGSQGPHGISTDPMYENPGARDYSLQPTSPCINAGDPDPAYNDPDGTRNDMGAFPYGGASPVLPATDESVIDLVKVIDDAILNADNPEAADGQSARVRELIDRLFFDSREN